MKYTKQEVQEAREELSKLLNVGDTVYCQLKHVSRSGMYRAIDLFVVRDNKPIRISWAASKLLEGYDNNHEGCKASGCGMDMGFHLVYSLGSVLFPKGFDLVLGQYGRNGDTSGHDNNGGYALRCEWL